MGELQYGAYMKIQYLGEFKYLLNNAFDPKTGDRVG
jgi:hypothetical protein